MRDRNVASHAQTVSCLRLLIVRLHMVQWCRRPAPMMAAVTMAARSADMLLSEITTACQTLIANSAQRAILQ